jgi:rhodanese-related sulfurtransferase
MPTPIEVDQLRRLMAEQAQVVEVLPDAEYEEQHLPGALNIPLKSLTAKTTDQLDRTRPVIVYCWDAL